MVTTVCVIGIVTLLAAYAVSRVEEVSGYAGDSSLVPGVLALGCVLAIAAGSLVQWWGQ